MGRLRRAGGAFPAARLRRLHRARARARRRNDRPGRVRSATRLPLNVRVAPFARAMWRFPAGPRGTTLDEMLHSAYDVVDLRRYAMRPGCRDTLIALFERAFIETQEAAGMVPVGHYRDLDDDDSYVWFRGFPQRAKRHDALDAFYTSVTWLENRNDANATLLDSDNVLLLRDARDGSGFDLQGLVRPAVTESNAESFVAAFVFMLDAPASEDFVAAF